MISQNTEDSYLVLGLQLILGNGTIKHNLASFLLNLKFRDSLHLVNKELYKMTIFLKILFI